ncbi:hypothetical protein HDV06_001127 [Boothiomyces sp. JEL0866]|nr:hypothetical protein HDV06_001127 [Boothiomyces sp. JEL0866]
MLPIELCERIYSYIPTYYHVAIALNIDIIVEDELAWVYIIKYYSKEKILKYIDEEFDIYLDLILLFKRKDLFDEFGKREEQGYTVLQSSWSIPPKDIILSYYPNLNINDKDLALLVYSKYNLINKEYFLSMKDNQLITLPWIEYPLSHGFYGEVGNFAIEIITKRIPITFKHKYLDLRRYPSWDEEKFLDIGDDSRYDYITNWF